MVEITPEEWRRIGEAIVVWSGWGRDQSPSRNDDALSDRFGAQVAAELLPIIRELEDDFYASDARLTAADLEEMGRVSAERFVERHPDCPEDAARALAWCYTFDYK